MSESCAHGCAPQKPSADPRYRRILWIALFVNATMFVIEIFTGWNARSVSLLADAIDFFGDSVNYALSLFVLMMIPIWSSRIALLKGMAMGSYGVFILGTAIWNLTQGTVPKAATMGMIGFIAAIANLFVAVLLYAYRNGDANMRSVWLCTRNDVIGNVMVMFAALGVFSAQAGWPDIFVATVMGVLGLTAAKTVVTQARLELKEISRDTYTH